MGIRSFFHKIKMGFVRMGETSIPYVSSTKRYGNYGEERFIDAIKHYLPNCRIKQNVIINTSEGDAEIDCLILFQDKIFAVEVKRWKGRLIETEQGFIQEKTDRWTGETHSKYLKSPFRQLNRAIYLLRKQIEGNVWVNGIVFFDDENFECLETNSENIWFSDTRGLTEYIKNCGQNSIMNNAEKFFNKCIAADYLYSKTWDKSLHCIIDDKDLQFQTSDGLIKRNDIICIQIWHHWSYDELLICLKNGKKHTISQENVKIRVSENGIIQEYALCKLDYIELGR